MGGVSLGGPDADLTETIRPGEERPRGIGLRPHVADDQARRIRRLPPGQLILGDHLERALEASQEMELPRVVADVRDRSSGLLCGLEARGERSKVVAPGKEPPPAR